MQMRFALPIIAAVVGCFALSAVTPLPAFATMVSPYHRAWLDHSMEFRVGADAAPQLFATGTVTPLGRGKFRYHLKCEHNDVGDAIGNFTLEFRSGNKVVYSFVKVCVLGGSGSIAVQGIVLGKYGGSRPEFDYTLDLSQVIDQIDNIWFWAKPGIDLRPGARCKLAVDGSCIVIGAEEISPS
jgi:hypothetical protein